jgi:hypothetical protein
VPHHASRRVLAASFALASLLSVSGCGGGTSGEGGGTTGPTTTAPPRISARTAAAGAARITLRVAAASDGPWKRSLSLKLTAGGTPVAFFVCAVWGRAQPADPCTAAPGDALPAGATMRLEQQPVGPAIERPDSPGWGLVGTSEEAALDIPLSSFVSGNRPGTVTYRVTLRNAAGRVLSESNTTTITWHR